MRLIDAEKIQVPMKMVHNISGCYMMRVVDVQRIISGQPTAFDKEKVVERLEELSRNHFESADAIGNEEEYGEAFAYKHAVEVVRKGGITNDIKL